MALICENCGGNVQFVPESDMMVCESCGTSRTLNDLLNSEYNKDSASDLLHIKTYKEAVAIMVKAATAQRFSEAALKFESINDFMDSAEMAAKCREEADRLKIEETYNIAIKKMNSGLLQEVKRAVEMFDSLGNYKDSLQNKANCERLIPELEKKINEIRKRQAINRKNRRFLICVGGIFLIMVLIFSNCSKYSKSNIHFSIKPDEGSYLVENGSSYAFNYDVTIKNKGPLDVKYINGTVVFEGEDNEILVDTSFEFSNYMSAVVRSHKKATYNWTLSVGSYDSAKYIFENDFKELDVRFDITSITYENGVTKLY